MRKLKIFSTIALILILALGMTRVNAYSGVVDVNDEITLPQKLTNGEGTIKLSRNIQNAQVSFQFVEMDSNTYKQIIKLKEELLVAQYYNIYEADQTEENYDTYVSAYLYYKGKYNETVDNYTTQHIDEVESIIIGLLPNYEAQWSNTSNNTAKIDLSSFNGTKYFTLWTKVVVDSRTIYEAEVYELTGTKANSDDTDNKDDNNTDNKNDNTDNKDDNNTDNKNDNTDNKDDNNTDNKDDNNTDNKDDNNTDNKDNNNNTDNKDNTNNKDNSSNTGKDDGKKDDTNTSLKDKTTANNVIPQTGETNIILISAIIIAIIIAIISYKKMRKIK